MTRHRGREPVLAGAAVANGVPASDVGLLGELREKELIAAGVSYVTTHAPTMTEPWQLYHPSVIQQFPEYFNDYYRSRAGVP